jgi:hypothetical protein
MDNADPNLPPPSTDPLAIASLALSVVGVVVYCCGSFLCIGWIAPVFWLIGAILGGVSVTRSEGTSKTLAIVGIALNVLFGLLMVALIFLGVTASVLSGMMDNY